MNNNKIGLKCLLLIIVTSCILSGCNKIPHKNGAQIVNDKGQALTITPADKKGYQKYYFFHDGKIDTLSGRFYAIRGTRKNRQIRKP